MIYEDRVVAFVDILGFKDLINSTVDSQKNEIETETEKINIFFNEIQREFISEEKWSDQPNTCTRIVTHFSDSIVFSVKALQKDGILFMLDYIHYLLITGIQYGIIFRGGITYGKVCHTEDKIFGPAMNEAYKMESKCAIYPRIIIDKEVLNSTFIHKGDQADTSDVKKYLETCVSKDDDNQYFIDYFSNVLLTDLEYAFDKHAYVEDLKSVILKLDEKIKTETDSKLKSNLQSKNNWLKTKFNKMIEQQKSFSYPVSYDESGFYELGNYFNSLTLFTI